MVGGKLLCVVTAAASGRRLQGDASARIRPCAAAKEHDGEFYQPAAYDRPVAARAILLSAALCILLTLFSVTQLIAVYAWLRAACSILTLGALWRLRRLAAESPRQFVVPGGAFGVAAVVLLPTALFAWALANSDPASRLWGPVYLTLGPLAFFLARSKTTSKSV